MPLEVVLLVVTALLAVVAVGAAVVAVKALKQVRSAAADVADASMLPAVAEPQVSPQLVAETTQVRPVEVIEGRVVATLTQQDLLEARLSRPSARLSVYAHGVAHALRPESRDRIVALVRREYRRRRSLRLKVARRALRSVPNEAFAQQPDWLGTDSARASLPRAVGE